MSFQPSRNLQFGFTNQPSLTTVPEDCDFVQLLCKLSKLTKHPIKREVKTMTANAISYLRLQEDKRANLVKEKETNRHNLADEGIRSTANDITRENNYLLDADRDASRKLDEEKAFGKYITTDPLGRGPLTRVKGTNEISQQQANVAEKHLKIDQQNADTQYKQVLSNAIFGKRGAWGSVLDTGNMLNNIMGPGAVAKVASSVTSKKRIGKDIWSYSNY